MKLTIKEMQGRDQISQIGIDTDIVIESRFKVQYVVLIGLLVDVLDRHLRVEELIEMEIALPVVSYCSFP